MTKFSHPLNSYFILFCLEMSPPAPTLNALPSKRARPRTRQKQFTAKIDSALGVHWLSRRHLNPVSAAPPPAPDCLSTSTFQRCPPGPYCYTKPPPPASASASLNWCLVSRREAATHFTVSRSITTMVRTSIGTACLWSSDVQMPSPLHLRSVMRRCWKAAFTPD